MPPTSAVKNLARTRAEQRRPATASPHLLRPLVGARPGGLLIPSAIGGAVLVLAADIAVRLTPAASEVKLGVAMAVLGGPFFFALLLSLRRRIA